MKKPKTIVFDVNETLLDLSNLKESINTSMQDERAADLWFSNLLHYSLVETVTSSYQDFSAIGKAVFKMIAENNNRKFSDDEVTEILKPTKSLKPHPDVSEGLSQCREEGYDLVAFSNGKPSVLQEQLYQADIDHYFSQILSVAESQKYKPHSGAYEYLLKKIKKSASGTLMVSAHGWDIAGAHRAGMQTCFVKRAESVLYPLANNPAMMINNLKELKNALDKI